jgi:hypothetical protein
MVAISLTWLQECGGVDGHSSVGSVDKKLAYIAPERFSDFGPDLEEFFYLHRIRTGSGHKGIVGNYVV